jgi:hypothetical protein
MITIVLLVLVLNPQLLVVAVTAAVLVYADHIMTCFSTSKIV